MRSDSGEEDVFFNFFEVGGNFSFLGVCEMFEGGFGFLGLA